MYEHNGKTFADSCKSHQQDPFLGTGGPTKMDEFSEKFQTAFDPPPLIFGKLYCGFRDKSAYVHYGGNVS